MVKNYFLTAIRNVVRHKTSSIINITGLMIGITAFLLIFLVAQYEQSFDNFHPYKNNIYRVVRIGKNPVNREYRSGVPFPVTVTLRNDFPQLKNACAIFGENDVQVDITAADGKVLKKFKEKNLITAEPRFFEMFNFPLAEGNAATALKEPNSVLLTKDVATKYFGDWKNIVGKTVKFYGSDMKVTGILNNVPANTDFPLSVVLSYATLMKDLDPGNWGSISDWNYCFVQLDDRASAAAFDQQLARFVDKYIKPVNPSYDLALQPLSEIHYDARYGNFKGTTFSKDMILALSLIALFLLIIACINFINLTTAQAFNRAREVGVRKVLGSNRAQLVAQFLSETGITAVIAFIGALAITFVCIPLVNNLLDIELTGSALYQPGFAGFMIGVVLLVTLFSGFYPALVLSGFKPMQVLKNTVLAGNQKGISLRRGLVVFQFVIAQVLIIGTLVVAAQMSYFRNADMGFTKTAIINADLPTDSLSRTKIAVLKSELNKIPGFEKISFSTFAPSSGGGWYTDLNHSYNQTTTPDVIVSMKPADTAFFSLYDLKLLAGRIYFASDTMREVVVNETVIHKLGIQKPSDAIGKMVKMNGRLLPIVGVVKDFHINSLRDPIGPVALTTMKDAYGLANIRINLSQAGAFVKAMREVWNKTFPDYVFEYQFFDQTIENYYKQENQLSQLYAIFSFIAIFISCLGLYGLISFMAAQRKKEIGIRKVLGAPVKDILVMLSKEFTVLILVAFVIAAPIAWYYMHQWLQQYTYRITMGAGFFVITILLSLIIAWLAVGYKTIRAASANPVKSLRSE